MEKLKIRNKLISTPLIDIIYDIRNNCRNGKLRTIKINNDNILVSCPNPNHKRGLESNASSGVYIGKSNSKTKYGTFHCFACDTVCSFEHFVALCFECSVEDACDWLIENYASEEIEYDIELEEISLFKPNTKQYLKESILDNFQSYHPYMNQRKLSREICERFKIKYSDNYLIFPFYDIKNNLLGLTKRSVLSKQFYIDPNIDKSQNLYLLNEIKNKNITTCAIVESQIDALTSFQYGMPAVATLGGITKEQVALLNKSGIRILYTIFDNDMSGERFTNILNKYIKKDILVINVKLPKGYKDVNDTTYDIFWETIKKST